MFATIVITICLAAVVAWIIWGMIRKKKKGGGGSCGCGQRLAARPVAG